MKMYLIILSTICSIRIPFSRDEVLGATRQRKISSLIQTVVDIKMGVEKIK